MSQSRAVRIVAIRHGEIAWKAAWHLQGQIGIPLNDQAHLDGLEGWLGNRRSPERRTPERLTG